MRVRTTKKDALALAAQVETTRQVDRQRVNMLPGGRSSCINHASHRLHRYRHRQPGALCDFASPGPGAVNEVFTLKDTLWRLNLPGIAARLALIRGVSTYISAPLSFASR